MTSNRKSSPRKSWATASYPTADVSPWGIRPVKQERRMQEAFEKVLRQWECYPPSTGGQLHGKRHIHLYKQRLAVCFLGRGGAENPIYISPCSSSATSSSTSAPSSSSASPLVSVPPASPSSMISFNASSLESYEEKMRTGLNEAASAESESRSQARNVQSFVFRETGAMGENCHSHTPAGPTNKGTGDSRWSEIPNYHFAPPIGNRGAPLRRGGDVRTKIIPLPDMSSKNTTNIILRTVKNCTGSWSAPGSPRQDGPSKS
ncbi:uncharacterized protein [Musca autumnalis]|uniref:uncharacterized protein n=1 Tax=Musca autumnalis TaxID=221902 RepID=UPI003CF6D9B4